MDTPTIIVDYASVIQTSLAPVFLLASTAAFVGIYNTRLIRVSDRLNEVMDHDIPRRDGTRQITYLRRRTLVLELAMILGVAAGLSTCASIVNLLSGALTIRLQPENSAWWFVAVSFRSCFHLYHSSSS